jgi:hypothetical protein
MTALEDNVAKLQLDVSGALEWLFLGDRQALKNEPWFAAPLWCFRGRGFDLALGKSCALFEDSN